MQRFLGCLLWPYITVYGHAWLPAISKRKAPFEQVHVRSESPVPLGACRTWILHNNKSQLATMRCPFLALYTIGSCPVVKSIALSLPGWGSILILKIDVNMVKTLHEHILSSVLTLNGLSVAPYESENWRGARVSRSENITSQDTFIDVMFAHQMSDSDSGCSKYGTTANTATGG